MIEKWIDCIERLVFVSSSSTSVMPQIELKQNHLRYRCLPLLALTMLCCTAVCMCCPVIALCWWWSQLSPQWLLLTWGTSMGGSRGCCVIPGGLSPGSYCPVCPVGGSPGILSTWPPLGIDLLDLALDLLLCRWWWKPCLQAKRCLQKGCTWVNGCSPGVLLFGSFLAIASCFMCSLKVVGIHG